MSRKESVVYPQVDPEEWAKLYGLEVEPRACFKCGIMRYPAIPFAIEGWRGLISETHGCGEDYNLAMAVRANPAERQEYRGYFNAVSNYLE